MNEKSDNNWSAMSDDGISRQIGEFIKYHRIEQHRTQRSLAKDAGISRSTLSLLERGESVSVNTLIRVLRILDRLQVFDGFTISRQPSPLLLAKAEKEKKKRIMPARNREKEKQESVDW